MRWIKLYNGMRLWPNVNYMNNNKKKQDIDNDDKNLESCCKLTWQEWVYHTVRTVNVSVELSLPRAAEGTDRVKSCRISVLAVRALLRRFESVEAATVGSSRSPRTTTSRSLSDTILPFMSYPTYTWTVTVTVTVTGTGTGTWGRLRTILSMNISNRVMDLLEENVRES